MMISTRTRTLVSFLALLLVFIVVAGAAWVAANRAVTNYQTGQRRLAAREAAAQHRAALAFERKLCTDLGTMALIQPPPGNAARNPSRAYEQAEHRAWAGLYMVIGCTGGAQ